MPSRSDPRTVVIAGLRVPYPEPATSQVTATMRGNRKRDTKPEVHIRSLLHRQGYRFTKDALLCLRTLSVRPDVVFPRKRVVVFVDGCFWHCCPIHGTKPRTNSSYWKPKLARNVERDAEIDKALEEAGWAVVRVWEHTAAQDAVAQIRAVIEAQAAVTHPSPR